jgi:peptide/nickel transport system permease protein
VSISCILGIILGCIAGYYGKIVDNVLMRVIDVMLSIPNVLLAVSIVAALGTSFFNLMLAIGLGAVPGYARIVRAAILSVKEQEYIEAARSNGAGDWWIVTRHILPNCMAPLIVQATMSIATSILSAAGMSFIGLGIMPPTPEWGSMLASGRSYIRDYWFIVTFPGLAIMLTIFSINLLGDGLRDALDPRLKS